MPGGTYNRSIVECVIRDCVAVHQRLLSESISKVVEMAGLVLKVIRQGGEMCPFGNGGSAAQAQHVATELVVRFKQKRRALPAIPLNADTAIITAAANDFDYCQVYARQVDALVTSDDLMVAFSASGDSPNVLEAVKAGRKKRATTVGFTGNTGGNVCELVYNASAEETAENR